MKNNYPIKYALMPIYKDEYESKDNILYYIVSKCYLLSKTIKYNNNGSEKQEYEVVFPFQYEYERRYSNTWDKIEPEFNIIYNNCINSINVDKIYDHFIDAQIGKSQKNKEIMSKEMSFIPFDENFQKNIDNIKEKYNILNNYYIQLENEIEDKTPELQINNKKVESNIILYYHGKYKTYNSSVYSMFNIFSENTFALYNISYYEYLELCKAINNDDNEFKNAYNHTMIAVNDKDSKIIKFIDPETEEEIFIKNDKIVKNYNLNYKEPYIHDIIMYTNNSYEDIINAYKYNIDDNKKITLTLKKDRKTK